MTENYGYIIKKVVDIIEATPVAMYKKATFMFYLTVFMLYKESVVRDNQFKVIQELTSPDRKDIICLFNGEQGWNRFNDITREMTLEAEQKVSNAGEKQTVEVEIHPEVSYATMLFKVLAAATSQKNAITEVKTQSLISIEYRISSLTL